MWMGVTLIEPGISDKELRTVINTNDIFCITELPDNPDATMVVFHKIADRPNAIIKGSYDQNAKVLFGFNRKL